MSLGPLPPTPPSAAALWRYTVLAQVEALLLAGWSVSAAIAAVAARDQVQGDGRPAPVSRRTIQRWRAAQGRGGLAALEPQARPRTTTSVVLPPALVDFLRTEKERDPRASVPELVRRAQVRGVIPADVAVDRTTVWRACCRMALPTRPRPSKREGDMRRWRYPHRMQCVLADGKHFRAGVTRSKRVALFFLDDATRYALQVCVGPSESTRLFLHGLHQLVRQHGLPELVYLDHGPGFIARDTLAVIQGGLRAWLIHGQAHYPAGHGAIERFHRTAHDQLLRSLDGALQVDPAVPALTLRLQHYLDRYNDTPHETLDGDTPRQRWEQGRPLIFPDNEAELYRRFVVRESRKVSADHVIQLDGRRWEAPRGSGDTWVEVSRHVLDGRLWVIHQGRQLQLAELEPHANAGDRRGPRSPSRPDLQEGLPHTAATLAYDQDFLPLVDAEGGFPEPPSPPESP
jgi:hypothetical protein